MAQKAAKTTAKHNTQILNRTHLTTLLIHSFYLFLRTLLFRRTYTLTSLTLYILLSLPALTIELLLERNSRPKYTSSGEVRTPGEDVDAKGLTEWMWDVLYWTWGCVGAASVLGDRAWWLWGVVPVYSVWAGWKTVNGVRSGLGGLMGQGADGVGGGNGNGVQAGSKRQAKMEKKGAMGQKVVYR